jgi:serine protease AprX
MISESKTWDSLEANYLRHVEKALSAVGHPGTTEVLSDVSTHLDRRFEEAVIIFLTQIRKGYKMFSSNLSNASVFVFSIIFLFISASTNVAIADIISITGTSSSGCPWMVQPLNVVNEFDDVRCNDISRFDLSDKPNLPATLWFNKHTIWPEPAKMPSGCDPNQILTTVMNPGLGVRVLHQQGITGKGVNVAIIDQPMYLNHPEFAGKIVAYYDTGCNSQSSMHGPAVASLLVGINCGTAPDANFYYVAAPSWLQDAAYYANALDWIIQQSESLPIKEKIRVVSVSAAPSGSGSPFVRNNGKWDNACERAEQAGILVLDCTSHRGLIGPCWYDPNDLEDPAKCTPGFPGMAPGFRPDRILVPCSPRTTAEQYYRDIFSYQYCGRGGLSWSIPYCAGVLAMAWQIRPEFTTQKMVDFLFESAHVNKQGARIINPPAFIELVTQTPSADLDRDGDVDFLDFSIFAEQWMQANPG